MAPDIHSILERLRGLWRGGFGAWHHDPRLEIQHLEDELKSDKLTESEKRQINRRLCELKGIHFDDLA
jgi:hypothetical protein